MSLFLLFNLIQKTFQGRDPEEVEADFNYPTKPSLCVLVILVVVSHVLS
jgi:hypothetical protein